MVQQDADYADHTDSSQDADYTDYTDSLTGRGSFLVDRDALRLLQVLLQRSVLGELRERRLHRGGAELLQDGFVLLALGDHLEAHDAHLLGGLDSPHDAAWRVMGILRVVSGVVVRNGDVDACP